MKKTRIACFIPFPRKYSGFGGAERRIPHIFAQLDSNIYDVSIVIVCYGYKKEIEKEISRYLGQSSKVVYVKSSTLAFVHFIHNRYDIVCFPDCVLRTIPAISAALFSKSKRVMLMESVNNSSFNFRRNWYKYFFWLNMKLSNHLDCLYPSCVHGIKVKFPKKVVTVTPSVLPRMDHYQIKKTKQNIILFSGRLIDQKNPKLFIDSVALIRDDLRKRGYSCLVCGEGPLKKTLMLYVKENGWDDFIQFKGYVNMEEITPAAKVFCSLQSMDNYPSQSLLEAISSGCYCIASNRGDTHRIVKSHFGRLVELDEMTISRAIADLLCMSDEDWLLIENNARRFARANFSVNKATGHYHHLFQSLL